MPRRQLTDRFCDHAKTDGQQIDYFDEAVSGLALRVSPTKKAWTWLYTQGGKRKRLTFATYPATSLAGARAKVELMRQEIEAGRDPLPQAETFKAIDESEDQIERGEFQDWKQGSARFRPNGLVK